MVPTTLTSFQNFKEYFNKVSVHSLSELIHTLMQNGFRERKRSFEAIVVDQFIGKLGEVAVKRFLEDRFNIKIEIDWDISP